MGCIGCGGMHASASPFNDGDAFPADTLEQALAIAPSETPAAPAADAAEPQAIMQTVRPDCNCKIAWIVAAILLFVALEERRR